MIREHFGFDCPGCGFQRAFISLLKGDLTESFLFYPALLPIIAMFVLLALHLKFKYRNGARWLKYIFIVNAALIFGNFILRLFLNHP